MPLQTFFILSLLKFLTICTFGWRRKDVARGTKLCNNTPFRSNIFIIIDIDNEYDGHEFNRDGDCTRNNIDWILVYSWVQGIKYQIEDTLVYATSIPDEALNTG